MTKVDDTTKVDDDVMMLLLMSIVKDFRHGGREVGKYPHEFSAYRDKHTPDDGQYIWIRTHLDLSTQNCLPTEMALTAYQLLALMSAKLLTSFFGDW